VRILRGDGSPLQAEVAVASGRLEIQLVITPELLAEQLQEAWIELAGLPSPGAIRTLDGRRLRATVRHRAALQPLLHSGSAEPPRLVSLNGAPPRSDVLRLDGELVLRFAGVLDPATVTASNCPLFPVAGELTLRTSRTPGVRWRCVGEEFDVLLTVPAGAGRLQCILRRMGLRDPLGRPPEPAGVVVELLAP
jgi:hypothetical protein